MMHRALLIGCALALGLGAAAPLRAAGCAPQRADVEWIRAAIDTWERASDLLDRRIDVMPWTVLYDETCVVHLGARDGRRRSRAPFAASFGGDPVPVASARYRKRFRLPDGRRLSSAALAFTSVAKDGSPFLVMALPSVWRKDRRTMPGEDVAEFASGIFAHEITHTIHIEAIAAAVEKLAERYEIPENLDDDLLQRLFTGDGEYVAAYEAEVALYASALRTPDDDDARAIVRRGLDASRDRRDRHFVGEHAFFREAEPLFLNMEGVASWVAYATVGKGADAMEFAGRFWSQQEGLLLFLLLERFDPTWKARVFAAEVPDPFEMLRGAVAGSAAPIP